MAYKTLYRKYRPTDFESLCGQDHIVKTLENSIRTNKISHAYLFTGTRGTGKTTTAKIFARMINCLDPIDNMPCGKCLICKTENTDEITDIIEIDAASNNGVDEIRELRNKVKLVPSMCKYKVYIIDEVHMLSTGAFNALLKTLEEPPEHAIFILATTEPQKLPMTIISRCQRFDFKKISEVDMVKRLTYIAKKEKIDIDKDAIVEISKMSGGALRDAIGLLDQLSSYKDDKITKEDIYTVNGSISREELLKLIDLYIEKDYENLLEKVEQIYLDGKNFYSLAENMLYVFREMLIEKKASKYFDSKDIIMKSNIVELSNKVDEQYIKNSIKELEKILVDIKDSNYPRVLFEIFLLSDIEDKLAKDKKVIEPVKIEKKEEVTEPIVEITEEEVIEDDDMKEILLNNTIYGATTICKKDAIKVLDAIDEYLLKKKYVSASTILKDAEVKAASSDHILLTYKYKSMVLENDKEIKNIEKIFSEKLAKKQKIVAITNDDWNKKRPYYLELNKNNQLSFKEEKINNKENKKSNANNIENDFSILIESEE